MGSVSNWFRRHFSDPQVTVLAILLIVGLAAILVAGNALAPVIASLVIAYILESPVQALARLRLPHWAAVAIVFTSFIGAFLLALVAVLPLLSQQVAQLVVLLPNMLTRVQEILLEMPQRYPELINRDQVVELTSALRGELLGLGQTAVLFSFDRIADLLTLTVYLFLVPLMVFFFLKDREQLVKWFTDRLPAERSLAAEVWRDVDQKIGAYLRGKLYEIGIVGTTAWVAFSFLDLDFALLLAFLTGVSVLIPYIGVAVVSVPVALVGLFQFGLGGELAAVLGAYAVIQILDGNLLAPLLISEVVNLHPIAVIVSILVFGAIWGFWGLFFAIPLATLATAVFNAWPRPQAAAKPARRARQR